MILTPFARNRVKIFLSFAVLFLSPQLALSSVRCESVFVDAVKAPMMAQTPVYGQLKDSFQHNTNYKVLLPELTQIKNQCSLGTCHLHSWVSSLEHNFAMKYGPGLKLSTHYLSALHWFEVSLDTLRNKSSAINPELGASVLTSRNAIRAYGLIPDEAWVISRSFQDAGTAKRTQEYLKNIIGQAKWRMEHEADATKVRQIKEEAAAQIQEVFSNVIGEFPESFLFHGRSYTPHEFAEKFFPELFTPLVIMNIAGSPKAKTIVEEARLATRIQTRLPEVEATARNLLDRGQNVYLTYSHNHHFVDAKTGIMSIQAFHNPKGSLPLSREQREHFKAEDDGHAVQIVGYDVDPVTGRVSKWKIKNSWGEDKGDHGYYHMYADYFDAFARGITFYRDGSTILPQAEAVPPKQLTLPF